MRRRRQSGFTLLELLVTVAVATVALSSGVPGFRALFADNRLSTQTNMLVASLAVARSEAVKRGVEVTVCGANADRSGCGGSGDWSAGWLVMAGNQIVRELPPLDGHNRLAGSDDVAEAIAFDPLGVPTASGSFWLCDGTFSGVARRVDVNTIGRVRVTRQTNATACA